MTIREGERTTDFIERLEEVFSHCLVCVLQSTNFRNGSKQRAEVVITKAPARVRSSPLKSNPQIQNQNPGGLAAGRVRPGPGSQPTALGPMALRLVEEEKRAVRRHRKRLARIVVDQWRFFAQKALLALAFRRRVLDRRKRQCWDAWREAVSKRRVKWTLQARALARRRLTLERQVWRGWIAHVQAQKRYQNAAARLLWMDAHRLYSTAFAAFKAHRTASHLKREATAAALSHWRRATLSRFLASWRETARAGQAKLAQRVGALQRWAAWRKRSVLAVWHQVTVTRKEQRAIGAWLEEKRVRRQKVEVLAEWRAALEQKRVEDAKLDRAYAFQYMYIVRRAVRRWALFVEQRKERRGEKERALRRAAEHADRQLVRRGFATWRAFVDIRREKAEAMRLAVAADFIRLKRLAFNSWRKYHRGKQWARADAAAAEEFANFQLKYKGILALKLHVQHKRRQEQYCIIAGRHWVKHMKRAAFAKWRAAAKAAVMEREATEEMLEEKKMAIVRAWQRDFFLSRALYCWQLYVACQRHSRHQHRKADRFLRSQLLRKAFTGFSAHVTKRRQKREMVQKADEAYQKRLLRRLLCVHWREALWRTAAKREAYSRAEAFRNDRLGRKSLEVWRVRTAKWALKSEALRRAAVHYERILLGRGLRAWSERVVYRQKKQRAEDERVWRLRQELGALVAGRVFAAWVEQHDQRLVRKLKSARARGHFREVYERRGLRVWRAWLVERKRKRKARQRAERLAERHSKRRAVAAWKEYVAQRRRKKEQRAGALRVWSRRMQRLAFQAWTSHLAERRAKAAALTSADRLYQTRLVHVAASHWLAKTRRRQQLRLQIALEKQALTSIAQLARVAPYARRWRHLARMRRAEQEGTQHRALLDGWAARNASAGWRSLPRTGPLSRASGLRRTDVSLTSAPVAKTKATSEQSAAVSQALPKAVIDNKSRVPEKILAPPLERPQKASPADMAGAPSGPSVRRAAEAASGSIGAARTGPVSSVVERITASIASGASILDALPPWARARSRPPPRRPSHLLTAGSRSMTAGAAMVDAANGGRNFVSPSVVTRPSPAPAGSRKVSDVPSAVDSIEPGRNPLGFGAGSGASGHQPTVSPLDELPASSHAKRAESFAANGSAPSSDGSPADDLDDLRTPEFVRPGQTGPGSLMEGTSTHGLVRKVAVSRQLVLAESEMPIVKVVGGLSGGALVRQTSLGQSSKTLRVPIAGAGAAQERVPEDFVPRAASLEDVRADQHEAIVPVGGLARNARVIAQEVTWMETVLREFDDLKAQSSECLHSLNALKKPKDPGESTSESREKGAPSGRATGDNLGRAERIWELEQRHAALELRKKLQLPMVKAVAKRIRTIAVGAPQ